ncbi:MAG: TfoX/Sxy family protein [Candidatus Gracilibacteria bacterium]|nr:TfoX/Sxy family protein [Candidatus Gracilibacteria bacterium]
MSKEQPEILCYFLEDLLEGEIGYRAKSMFSGWGIYKLGKMFAILIDDEFYFKTGENNLKDYLDAGSKPFSYHSNGKNHIISYYKIPENILEDRNELKLWIKKSLEVVLKTTKKSKNKNLAKEVLEYLKTIPKGKVITYKVLASIFKVHSRTIASIMKQNRNQDLYACYKVIMSDGSLGGYNLGIDEKIKKLQNDGIEVIDGRISKKYFFND